MPPMLSVDGVQAEIPMVILNENITARFKPPLLHKH